MYVFIERDQEEEFLIYSKANNKYMKNYDPTKPSKFITLLDMNNLYGWAMSSYLPYGGFKFLKMLIVLM